MNELFTDALLRSALLFLGGLLAIVSVGMLMSGCGSDQPVSCESTALSDKTLSFMNGVDVHIHSDCTYAVPACDELGTWQPSGHNQVEFSPTQTTCGGLETETCDYVIMNSKIGMSCK